MYTHTYTHIYIAGCSLEHHFTRLDRGLVWGVNPAIFGGFSRFSYCLNFAWFWGRLTLKFDSLARFPARGWSQIDLGWNFICIQIFVFIWCSCADLPGYISTLEKFPRHAVGISRCEISIRHQENLSEQILPVEFWAFLIRWAKNDKRSAGAPI